MRILYVYGMAETKDIPVTLRQMGYKVEEYPKVQNNSILSDDETDEIVTYVKRHRITHLISIHLIYNLALAAYKADTLTAPGSKFRSRTQIVTVFSRQK